MKKTARRSEPKVAEFNKQRAIGNIHCKLRILNGWVENGIPVTQSGTCDDIPRTSAQISLEYFPKSVRQFNAWDASQNSNEIQAALPTICRNANDTLRKHAHLRSEVVQTIESLRLRAADQFEGTKPLRIGKLRAALKLEVHLRTLLEHELIAIRRDLKAEKQAHNNVVQKVENQSKEFKEYIGRLTNDNERLSEENSVLIRKLTKIAPLRKA